METIVLSGINLFEGGALSVYKDCLDSMMNLKLYEKYSIVAFVHNKDDFIKYRLKVEIIELPNSRRHYLWRLYYEYVYFFFYSLNRKVDYWISLHDITPNVLAKKRFVYCHNPSPFLEKPELIKDISKNLYYMSKYYKYLYSINIRKNNAVIVQQVWLRNELVKMFRLENVIVSLPEISKNVSGNPENREKSNDKFIFVYASYPRAFKNFEIICEAVKLIAKKNNDFEVVLTINGSENAYSKMLYEKYKDIETINWVGLMTREKVFEIYHQSDCMIFPSKLETWGLPISEYKETGKPLLVADFPYAHETVGDYDKVCFFNAYSPEQLAQYMMDLMNNKLEFHKSKRVSIDEPYARNWDELFKMILQ